LPAVHGFRDDEAKLDHFDKHWADFPDITSADEYERLAVEFLTAQMTKTMLECIRTKGDRVGDRIRFDKATQLYAVCDKDGYLRTFFIPTLAWHHLSSNIQYFESTC
jgi:pyocin large subunit-like protein